MMLRCNDMGRVLLATVFLTCTTLVAARQERGPTGEIYGELVPFVGLSGVRVEVNGLGVGKNTAPDWVADPAKAMTGLSHAEHEQLGQAIKTDIAETFRANAIPLLTSDGSATDTRPLLAIQIQWNQVRADTITVQVRMTLLEAARLLKDSSRIVWSATWGSTYHSLSSGPDLADVVRSVTRVQVRSFATLYARAHAKLPEDIGWSATSLFGGWVGRNIDCGGVSCAVPVVRRGRESSPIYRLVRDHFV